MKSFDSPFSMGKQSGVQFTCFFEYALRKSKNAITRISLLAMLFCLGLTPSYAQDADNDGVLDNLDLDNDNDGILDIDECVPFDTVDQQVMMFGEASGSINTATLHSNGDSATITASSSENFKTGINADGYLRVAERVTQTINFTSDKPLTDIEILFSSIHFQNGDTESNYFGNLTFTLANGTLLTNEVYMVVDPPPADMPLEGASTDLAEVVTIGGADYFGDPDPSGGNNQAYIYLRFSNLMKDDVILGGGISSFTVSVIGNSTPDVTANIGIKASLLASCNSDVDNYGILN